MPGAGRLHCDGGHIGNTANVRVSNQATADFNPGHRARKQASAQTASLMKEAAN